VNNKYDCLKLHHVGYLIKQIHDARNHKYKNSFDVQEFYVLPRQRIYALYMDLRTNSNYFPLQL
jgi:hypothetical protein